MCTATLSSDLIHPAFHDVQNQRMRACKACDMRPKPGVPGFGISADRRDITTFSCMPARREKQKAYYDVPAVVWSTIKPLLQQGLVKFV